MNLSSLDGGLPFRQIVTTGNEIGVTTLDFMDYFIRDPHTDIIAGYVEGLKDARRLLEIGDAALAAGKPILMWKVGGAKAAMGAGLSEVIAASQKAIDNTRSMGIGLSTCTIPEVGQPNFTIEPGKMEVGIGHHGEPGLAVMDLESSARIAARMADVVLQDLPFRGGEETSSSS